MQTGGLECMNCHNPTSNEDGRIFAEVFVCPACYLLAERMYKRMESELRGLLLVAKDGIREMLVQGKLQFPEGSSPEGISKREVLQAIMQIEEKKHDGDRRQVRHQVPRTRLPRPEDH